MPIVYILIAFFSLQQLHARYTVMINPAGDSSHAGRQVDDFFERGLTLHYANSLQKKIEQELPEIRVVISRSPGETIDSLHIANFANRLNVDFCLNIHFFQEHTIKPTLFIYYVVWNPLTDFWQRTEALSFIAYDQAHQKNLSTTKKWALSFYQVFCDPAWNNMFDKKGIYSFPFKPMLGLTMPAIALEVGLRTRDDMKLLTDPIIESLKRIFLYD